VIYYVLAIIIGSSLLLIPGVSLTTGETLNYENAIFIATSAFTDTGLTPVNISEKFAIFGQILIMLFIQFGGIGLVAVKYLILWVIFDTKKISDSTEDILHLEKGGTQRQQSTIIIRRSLIMFFLIELVSFLIFSIYFLVQTDTQVGTQLGDNKSPIDNEGQAIFYGLFHSISSMNNAGFDIFGGRSLQAFEHDQFIQTFTIIFFIIGGIGFPILYDLVYSFKAKYLDNRKGKLMLLTKIVLVAYFGITLFGISLALISEAIVANNINEIATTDEGKTIPPLFNRNEYTNYEKWMNIMFHTSSARSAGFSFYPIEYFSPSTRALIGILMFIGAGPSSTGGGIRVSSFFIIIAILFSYGRRKGQINVFKRTIDKKNKISAYKNLVSSGVIVILIAVLITLSLGVKKDSINSTQEQLFFETVSAFGTTGLSYGGLTSSLIVFPKLLLCLIMIIGQVGMNNVLTMFRREGRVKTKLVKKYPTEYIPGI